MKKIYAILTVAAGLAATASPAFGNCQNRQSSLYKFVDDIGRKLEHAPAPQVQGREKVVAKLAAALVHAVAKERKHIPSCSPTLAEALQILERRQLAPEQLLKFREAVEQELQTEQTTH
jgi:hypothetical protein